jgi:hypothetical protein
MGWNDLDRTVQWREGGGERARGGFVGSIIGVSAVGTMLLLTAWNWYSWGIMWEAVTAIGTCVLVVITWWAFWRQLGLAREQMRVEIQLKQEDRFDSEPMVQARSSLARLLLRRAAHEEIQEDVMNFFETIGMLLRRRYLDREMVWADFSFHALRWWTACKDYIREERARKGNDATIFQDFESMVDALYVIEQVKLRKSRADLEPSADSISEFLREEAALVHEDANEAVKDSQAPISRRTTGA